MSKDTKNTKLWKLFEQRDLLESTIPNKGESDNTIIGVYKQELKSVNEEIDKLLRD